jgi:hypothetical protein
VRPGAPPRIHEQLTPKPTQLTNRPRNIPSATCVAPPEDEQVMFEIRRGP